MIPTIPSTPSPRFPEDPADYDLPPHRLDTMKKPYTRHYLVITEFEGIVHSTQDLDEAKRECAEWAEHDDMLVVVMDSQESGQTYKEVYRVDGYSQAVDILYE